MYCNMAYICGYGVGMVPYGDTLTRFRNALRSAISQETASATSVGECLSPAPLSMTETATVHDHY